MNTSPDLRAAAVLEKMARLKLIPVYTPSDAQRAPSVCRELEDAGLPAIEITMRTPCAAEALSFCAKAKREDTLGEDFLILAGTVLNAVQAETALLAGASGIVSPGLDESVAEVCREHGVPYFPGVSTATELTRAVSLGLEIVKFFPAEANGGIPALKALSAPFPGVRFMPTGGIGPGNLANYLALPQVVCCGGSFMFPKGKREPGDVCRAAKKAVGLLSGEAVPAPASFAASGPVCGFGEVMIRLSSEPGIPLRDSKGLDVCCGGSEANALALLSAFGEPVEMLTALPEGRLGDLPLAALKRAGIGVSRVVRGKGRCGLYFLEKGFDSAPSEVIYDGRGSAFALTPSETWKKSLPAGASWLHISGITPALSEDARDAAIGLAAGAKAAGIPVSLDVNYRANLWTREEASRTLSRLAGYSSLCVINEEAAGILGVEAGEISDRTERTAALCRAVSEKFGIPRVAATVRTTVSQERGRLGAVLYTAEDRSCAIAPEREFGIIDRAGSGDCFTGGLIYALRHSFTPGRAAEFALACAVLKHYTPGDMPSVTLKDVEALLATPARRS